MSTIHALTVCARDDDGDPYRHELVVEEATGLDDYDVRCTECATSARIPHPVYGNRSQVVRCRGLVLCGKDVCALAHLLRHSRAVEAAREREAAKKGRRAA